MFVISAGVLALTSLSANADTISIGPITTADDGSGGTLWTYPIVFNNSTIDSAQPTSFNINDFGALKTTGPLPTGFTFSPGVSFTLDNSQLVGPNFGLPGFVPNNASVLDVVIKFTGDANMALPSVTFNLVLDTAVGPNVSGLANFFSQDIVQTGALAGRPNAVQQLTLSPEGVPTTPDGGATVLLLGAGLSALGIVRRYLKR